MFTLIVLSEWYNKLFPKTWIHVPHRNPARSSPGYLDAHSQVVFSPEGQSCHLQETAQDLLSVVGELLSKLIIHIFRTGGHQFMIMPA